MELKEDYDNVKTQRKPNSDKLDNDLMIRKQTQIQKIKSTQKLIILQFVVVGHKRKKIKFGQKYLYNFMTFMDSHEFNNMDIFKKIKVTQNQSELTK